MKIKIRDMVKRAPWKGQYVMGRIHGKLTEIRVYPHSSLMGTPQSGFKFCAGYEVNISASQMSVAQSLEFLALLAAAISQAAVLTKLHGGVQKDPHWERKR